MRFGRLILGSALLGALVGVAYVAVMWSTHRGVDAQDAWFSEGDLMFVFGLFGLVLGATFGLVVWAGRALSRWLTRR